MNNPRRGKTGISAFALASLSSSVSASITIEDVLAMRPDWTRQMATQFLQAHGSEIAEAMSASGSEVLFEMLTPRSSHAN